MSEPALRASDAERERTVELLRRHSVDGRLTLEEFAERIGLAYEAKTRDELDELTRDLPAETASVPARRRKPARWMVSVMGGTDRRGRFRLGTATNVVTLMGGANIDLRQAELGGKAYRPGKQPLPPGAPLIRVRAFTFMGGVSVITKRAQA